MRTRSVKELDYTDIGKVVKFSIPNPVLAGTSHKNTSITVVGTLQGFTKVQAGGDLILEVGTGRHVISEIFQEILDVSFPGEEA